VKGKRKSFAKVIKQFQVKCSVEIDVVTDRGATVRGVCKIKSEKFSVSV
jgi:hypothetical protein